MDGYTKEQQAELEELDRNEKLEKLLYYLWKRKGYRQCDLASIIDVHTATVSRYITKHRLRIGECPLTKTQLQRYIDEGLKTREIADLYDMTQSNVCKIMKKQCVKSKRSRGNPTFKPIVNRKKLMNNKEN